MAGFGRFLLIAVLALGAAGCGANFSTAYRTYEVDGASETTSIVIDAKQRAILSAPAGSDVANRKLILCAEPSPDALSAITSNFAGSFGGIFGPSEEVQAALAQSFSETASQLGVRNATIQLLRDGLYRQCEAYMNGLIGKAYYEQIANKYVNAMLVLLATEELTPGKAKAVKIAAQEGSMVTAGTKISLSGAPPEEASTEAQAPAEGQPPAETQPPAGDQGGGPTAGQPGEAEGKASAPAPVVGVNLPDDTAKVDRHISNAVNTMVTWFLTKDTVDYCLRALFAGETPTHKELDETFKTVCSEVIRNQMAQQAQMVGAFQASVIGQSGVDESACAKAIEDFWMPGGNFDDENEAKILKAISDLGLDVDIADLVALRQFKAEKLKVGARLGLTACTTGG